MGSTTNYNWNIGIKGQNPWWDEWEALWTNVDAELYKQTIYGEMYANNIGQVVTILSKDVYVQVPAGLTGGLNNGFTFQNARELKCLVAGVYQIHWSMSMQATAQSTEIEGAVMLNGTAQAKGTAHAEVSIGGINRPETISGSLILALAVNDLVSLGVANHTDVADVNLQHASLTLRRISD